MWELLGNVPIIRLNGFDTQLRAATFNGEANILFDLCCEALELAVTVSSALSVQTEQTPIKL